MLDKTSREYNVTRRALGLDGLDVNIPRTWHYAEPNTPQLAEAAQRIQDAHSAMAAAGWTDAQMAVELTRMLNTHEFTPRRRFYVDAAWKYGRAFFAVSRYPLNRWNVLCISHTRIIRMYGGKCMQRVPHYHYMIVTEFPVKLRDIAVLPNINVTIVGTDTWRTKAYIKNQLYPGTNVLDYTDPRYAGDVLEWVNPECDPGLMDTQRLTRTRYVFDDGLLTSRRDSPRGLRCTCYSYDGLPRDTPYPLSHVFLAEWCAVTNTVIGALVRGVRDTYRGQPAIVISSVTAANTGTIQNYVQTNFRQCAYLGIRVPSSAINTYTIRMHVI